MQIEGPFLQVTECLVMLSNLSSSQGCCRSQSNINWHTVDEKTNTKEK